MPLQMTTSSSTVTISGAVSASIEAQELTTASNVAAGTTATVATVTASKVARLVAYTLSANCGASASGVAYLKDSDGRIISALDLGAGSGGNVVTSTSNSFPVGKEIYLAATKSFQVQSTSGSMNARATIQYYEVDA